MTFATRVLLCTTVAALILRAPGMRADEAAQAQGRPAAQAPAVTHTELVKEQLSVAQQLQQLPPNLRLQLERNMLKEGVSLPENLRSLLSGQSVPRFQDERIFRTVKDEMKPIVVRQGNFVEAFPNRQLPAAAIPTGAEAAIALRVTRSVGRIETDGQSAHAGTAFVVGNGLVATNCHVLRKIVVPAAGGQWALATPGSAVIDFGDTRTHSRSEEYMIQGIAGFSSTRFFDVAVLRVAPKSREGDRDLPAGLPLHAMKLDRDWTNNPLRVGVVGYPDLTNLTGDEMTQTMFRTVRESGPDNVKLFSPGLVVGVDSYVSIEFLEHIASTISGQSGSPVIDRVTGEVVGIHYCCAEPGAPQQLDQLDCSSQRMSDRANNQAISTWTSLADRTVGPLLAVPRAAANRAIPRQLPRFGPPWTFDTR